MQILDQCTLLQAAEYIAFGWEPLSKEEDFTEKRVRYYIGETDEKYNNILDEQLMDLDRAKITLFALIDYGLILIDENNKCIKIDKQHIVEHDFCNLSLGLIYDSSDNQSFIRVKDGEIIDTYRNLKILFNDLVRKLKAYKQIIPPVDHNYRLILDNNVLYLQRDNDVLQRKQLYSFAKDKKTIKLFSTIVNTDKKTSDDGTILFSREELVEFLENNDKEDRFSNALERVIRKLREQDVYDAFFKITSQDTVYRPIVSDSLLYKSGFPIPKA